MLQLVVLSAVLGEHSIPALLSSLHPNIASTSGTTIPFPSMSNRSALCPEMPSRRLTADGHAVELLSACGLSYLIFPDLTLCRLSCYSSRAVILIPQAKGPRPFSPEPSSWTRFACLPNGHIPGEEAAGPRPHGGGSQGLERGALKIKTRV